MFNSYQVLNTQGNLGNFNKKGPWVQLYRTI